MFSTNNTHQATFCPKNFLIVLAALVCFLSSAVVSAQEARMLSAISQVGAIPGNSCDAGLTVANEDRSNCIEIHASNFDAENATNISRTLAPNPAATDPEANGYLGIVDWVVVELRVFDQGETVTGQPGDAQSIHRQPALLRSDGTIVNANAENLLAEEGDDSMLTLSYEGFDDDNQDAYIIIEHRVHLGVMSANPINPDQEYNFGSSASQLFQGANNASLKSETWAATSGDTDGDGQIVSADTLNVLGEQGRTGYNLSADTDLSSGTLSGDTLTIIRAQGRSQSYVPSQ